MDPKVKYFLSLREDEKKKNLINLGLCNKVYSPDNKKNPEFPFMEWDKKTGISKYYKLEAVETTDEEYEEIMKTAKEMKKAPLNSVARLIFIIAGIVFVAGFAGGFFVNDTKTTLFLWALAFISSIFTMGFAEIISLLSDIKNK